MAAPIPNLPGLQSLPISFTGGMAGPSSSGSNAGISTPITLPINLDHSGWNVNIKGQATQSANGNRDANGSSSGGLLGGVLGGGDMPLLAAAALVAVLLLRR